MSACMLMSVSNLDFKDMCFISVLCSFLHYGRNVNICSCHSLFYSVATGFHGHFLGAKKSEHETHHLFYLMPMLGISGALRVLPYMLYSVRRENFAIILIFIVFFSWSKKSHVLFGVCIVYSSVRDFRR